jgi:hypothetical protein
MASFGLYRSSEVQVIFGALTLKDARADTFVSITADEESFGTIKGINGEITRYYTGNGLVSVEYTCKRSSNDNQALSALHIADIQTPGGAGVAEFIVKDAQGATKLVSKRAWIRGFPDVDNGKEVGGDVTWTFDMHLPDGYVIGGNQI